MKIKLLLEIPLLSPNLVVFGDLVKASFPYRDACAENIDIARGLTAKKLTLERPFDRLCKEKT